MDDQFDDLKQFIDARISQSEVRLEGKIDAIEGRFDALDKKVDDGFAGAGEALDVIHQQIDELNTTTNQRLTKLEQKAA